MEIVTLIYLSGAITGTVVGAALDPLSLNEEERKNKVTIQSSCEETTTQDAYGQISTIKTCRTMKTVQN